MKPTRLLCVAALAASLLPRDAHPQGAVHLVDALDPGAHHSLQAAADAASDGDVLLVRHLGSGQLLHLAGRSLAVVADVGSEPYVGLGFPNNHTMDASSNHTLIEDLQAGQRVVLRGISFAGLQLRDAQGQVWVEDASINFISPAMRATDCAEVVLHEVELRGANNVVDQYLGQSGGDALQLQDTTAVLHAVTADGGQGHSFLCSFPHGFCSNSSGFHGIAQSGGSLWLADAELSGGNGGAGGKDLLGFCSPGGSGGHGLFLADAGPSAALRHVAGAGGAAASGPDPANCVFGSGGDGVPGQAIAVQSGSAQALAGSAVSLHAASPVREAEMLVVTLAGRAGTPVWLLAGPDSGLGTLGPLSGPLLVDVPALVVAVGELPAGGKLTLQARVQELGAGVESRSWTLQVVTREDGQFIAGPATTLFLLDESF